MLPEPRSPASASTYLDYLHHESSEKKIVYFVDENDGSVKSGTCVDDLGKIFLCFAKPFGNYTFHGNMNHG